MSLALAIKKGDDAAFELAFKQWRSKGYYYFLRKTNSEEDAKDLIQSTFLKLWNYRNSINTDFSLDQQLFHIARTVLIDHIRKANKQKEINAEVDVVTRQKSLENFQSMEFDTKRQMQRILKDMPELRRKVFELNKLEGYSYKEVAAHLGISEKSVDNHLVKALRKLRQCFSVPLFLIILLLK